MKKSSNMTEGYFSFNTPTGSRITKGESVNASDQPVFNDFACMPESENSQKKDEEAHESNINYF